jgi:zinc transporter, ZIP family
MLVLVLAATGTALATGLGAIPVFLLGPRANVLRPALWGVAGGVMTVASILGLLKPALDEGSVPAVAGGLAAGLVFLGVTRRLFESSDVHVGALRGADVRTSVLVFVVLFAHSLPEGLAIGTAYSSETAGLGVFVILAIAIQNVPEGTSVAIPMAASGFTAWQQFWAAVATSIPQPIGAVIAFLAVEQVGGLLPVSFAFAAGAMLALVALEMAPEALRREGRALGVAGLASGGAVMWALSALLNV